MAVVNIAPSTPNINGSIPTVYTLDSDDQYDFVNDGRIVLYLTGGAANSVITFQTGGTVAGLAVADKTLNLAASARRLVGPFPTAPYNNDQGKVRVTSNTDDCTLIAIKF